MPSSGQVATATFKRGYKCRSEVGRNESLALRCFYFIFGFKKKKSKQKNSKLGKNGRT